MTDPSTEARQVGEKWMRQQLQMIRSSRTAGVDVEAREYERNVIDVYGKLRESAAALAARLSQTEEENVQLEAERVYEHARAEVAERRFSQAEEALVEAAIALEVLHAEIPYFRMWPWTKKLRALSPELQTQIAAAVAKIRAALAASSAGEPE